MEGIKSNEDMSSPRTDGEMGIGVSVCSLTAGAGAGAGAGTRRGRNGISLTSRARCVSHPNGGDFGPQGSFYAVDHA